jgi:hypothetical protein
VSASADGVTGHPEQRQDDASHNGDDADRLDNSDFGDEPDDEENDSENDQGAPGNCQPPYWDRGGEYLDLQ